MANEILLFPTLTDGLLGRIRFQKTKYSFFYSDKDGEEYELSDEPVEALSSICYIKDENGIWTQDDYNIGFRRRYCLRTFQCLFGPEGIACRNGTLGLAIIWTSSDSKQRGVIPVGTFSVSDQIFEAVAEKHFGRAQLRGEVKLSTVLYLANAGSPEDDELHLADKNGYILGELENYTIRLDGSGSAFPIFEISEPGQPLWYVKCDWVDPTVDALSDCVSINLNTSHKNYKFIDRKQKYFNEQLLSEIMASAVSVIVETARLSGFWDSIMGNDNLEQGSVGQAIFYFHETLEWDLSSPESVSLSARKYFDQRM